MIAGFTEGFHGSSIAIIENGSLTSFDVSDYRSLSDEQISLLNSCEYRGFYENVWLKKTRQIYSGQYNTAFSKRQLSVKPTHYFNHHKSHIATAFQTSPFEESTGIVVDSIGEWDSVSIWKCWYDSGFAKYKKLWSKKYPFSIGLFYSSITDKIGLIPNKEENIFMGMSSQGNIDESLIRKMTDQLRNRNNHRGCRSMYDGVDKFDLATNTQVVLENELFEIFTLAKQLNSSNNVCYGGGVAFNSIANKKLKSYYDDMWIFKNPSDAGSAVGAAALVYGKKVNV